MTHPGYFLSSDVMFLGLCYLILPFPSQTLLPSALAIGCDFMETWLIWYFCRPNNFGNAFPLAQKQLALSIIIVKIYIFVSWWKWFHLISFESVFNMYLKYKTTYYVSSEININHLDIELKILKIRYNWACEKYSKLKPSLSQLLYTVSSIRGDLDPQCNL